MAERWPHDAHSKDLLQKAGFEDDEADAMRNILAHDQGPVIREEFTRVVSDVNESLEAQDTELQKKISQSKLETELAKQKAELTNQMTSRLLTVIGIVVAILFAVLALVKIG